MITRRQYFAIALVFAAVFMLFQGLQIGRMYFINTTENRFMDEITQSDGRKASFLSINKEQVTDPQDTEKSDATGSDVTGSDAEKSDAADNGEATKPEYIYNIPDELADGGYVLYVGKQDDAYAQTVAEWAYCTCRRAAYSEELPGADTEPQPDVIILAPYAIPGNEIELMHYLRGGTNVIFAALPDHEYVKAHNTIRILTGIYRIYRDEVSLHGMHLFSGFLLGGERVFDIEDPADPEDDRQDLDLETAWYRVRIGTETYLRGVLNEDDMQEAVKKKLKNEDMPAVIWRNHFGNGDVFSINGDFFTNRRIGIGLLEAMMNKCDSYDLYPVINAKLFTLGDYPFMTNENNVEAERLFGTGLVKASQNVVLPMLVSLTAQYDVKPTLFATVKYDYDEGAQPVYGELKYYLESLYEMKGELGISTVRKGTKGVISKLKEDAAYYGRDGQIYPIAAMYIADNERRKMADQIVRSGVWQDVRTIVYSDYTDEDHIVGYKTNGITYQQTTTDLKRHTFMDDLEYMGVFTTLGYCNASYDVARSFYPEKEKDEWQNASRKVFSNLMTYSEPYDAFEWQSVTEGDARVRTYLSVNCRHKRDGDTVMLYADGFSGTAYFVLRVHDEEIDFMTGGSYKKIEDGAYLLSVKTGSAKVHLVSSLVGLIDMKGGSR